MDSEYPWKTEKATRSVTTRDRLFSYRRHGRRCREDFAFTETLTPPISADLMRNEHLVPDRRTFITRTTRFTPRAMSERVSNPANPIVMRDRASIRVTYASSIHNDGSGSKWERGRRDFRHARMLLH